jgi:hypothetical protein
MGSALVGARVRQEPIEQFALALRPSPDVRVAGMAWQP